MIRETAGGLRTQVTAAVVTAVLGVVAIGFLTTAGVVLLAGAIGVPLAAVAFSALFGLSALAAHLVGRAAAARRAARLDAAHRTASIEIARGVAAAAGRTRSLLPLAAFLAAFVLTRRS